MQIKDAVMSFWPVLAGFNLCLSVIVCLGEKIPISHGNTPTGPPAAGGIPVESQWRPSSSGQYHLLEVFYTNETGKSVELRKPRLDALDLGSLTNGVVWTDFYPIEKIEPGQTV